LTAVKVRGRRGTQNRSWNRSRACKGDDPMMRTILVPWDGSEHSRRALDFLLKLLKEQTAAEVHLLNVQHGAAVLDRIAGGRPSEIQRTEGPATEAGRKVLDSGVKALAAAGVPHVARVVVGDAPHEIVEYAKTHHADAIVMGTRGLGTVGTLVLGSTAHKVLHLTHVPVTLVK
jgi:nucleotide-binding universal stress UspA family protein